MFHPNVDPRLLEMVGEQLMYKDMKVGQWIVVTAEDAETGKQGKVVLRVLSIRENNNDSGHDVTFEYQGDNFTFWLPEARGKIKIKPDTFLEAGISANLIPHFIQRMVGIGGIGSRRDYLFECVGGECEKQIIIHKISKLETLYNEKEKFQPPDLSAHLAKTKKLKRIMKIS